MTRQEMMQELIDYISVDTNLLKLVRVKIVQMMLSASDETLTELVEEKRFIEAHE